jgi:hypothetical protein
MDYFLHFSRGVKTSNDKKFVIDTKRNSDCYKLLRGKNIFRYFIDYKNLFLWYRPDLMKEKEGCLVHTKEIFFVQEKIIMQGRSGRYLIATLDEQKYFVLDTAYFSKIIDLNEMNIKYFLSIINSKLINFWYGLKFKTATISGYELHQIPVKKINLSKQSERKKHDWIVELVDQTLLLYKKYNLLILEIDRISIKKKIDILNNQIEQLVYELYGLTKEEIKIVEKSINGK